VIEARCMTQQIRAAERGKGKAETYYKRNSAR
jgi:hypothetical protein